MCIGKKACTEFYIRNNVFYTLWLIDYLSILVIGFGYQRDEKDPENEIRRNVWIASEKG